MLINTTHYERTLKNTKNTTHQNITTNDTIGISLLNSDIFITTLHHSII